MSRAVQRRYSKLRLNKIKKNKKNSSMIRRMLMSIPLLPADRIDEGFRAIISFAKQKRLFKRLVDLFNYFERYWLNNQVTYFELYCLPARTHVSANILITNCLTHRMNETQYP